MQEPLELLLLSWSDIAYDREVVLFAVGLMSDPTPLVDHVYQMLINVRLEEIKEGYKTLIHYDYDL